MPIIAPSLLASDFLHLQDVCTLVNESEADWFHLDVMDGRFVPNISFGLPVIEQIRKAAKKPCDVHLMILEPEKYTEAFKHAGADTLTVHIEACPHLHRNIQQIKDLGMKAGVAINPHTPVDALKEVLQDIDMVLVMSVNPGFGGQRFIPYVLDKVRKLDSMRREKRLALPIEIDGGVHRENLAEVVRAGCDWIVTGSAVFHSGDPEATVREMREIASNATAIRV
jgi:ribulose-phosphate 3-epimerase